MQTCCSRCIQGEMEISEDDESKILLLPGNLLIKIPCKNTQSQQVLRGHSNFNSAIAHKETIRKLLKVEENTKQPSSNTTVQLQQSQQLFSQEDADNNSNSSCLSRQPTKESLQTDQLIRVAVTQYFMTTKMIEVTYDNENGYKGFENISRILEELKTMHSLFSSSSSYASPSMKDILSQLSEYAELLKITSFETQTQKCINNQEFALSSRVSHAFLEPIANEIRKQHSRSCGLMFYENLKRVSFGFSCEQRGLSEELCNFIGISKIDLQNGCLLHSYISFLSPQSQQQLISFNIQLRLAALKKENILRFNKKQFEAEIITSTSSRFACMIEIEICRISYKQDFNSDHWLVVYHIFPEYASAQLNCMVAIPSKLEDQSSDNNSPKMSASNLNVNKNKQSNSNLKSSNLSANTSHYRTYIKQFPC